MIEDHARELGSRGWRDDFIVHENLALFWSMLFLMTWISSVFSAAKQDPIFRAHASIRVTFYNLNCVYWMPLLVI